MSYLRKYRYPIAQLIGWVAGTLECSMLRCKDAVGTTMCQRGSSRLSASLPGPMKRLDFRGKRKCKLVENRKNLIQGKSNASWFRAF